jgi:hypothetical protein
MIVSALTVNSTRHTGAQPHSGHAFERLHVALAGLRERRQFGINLRARSGGEFAPLARGGRSERDLFHKISHTTI